MRPTGAGPDSHVWSVILSLPLFAGGVLGVNATLADPSPQGAWVRVPVGAGDLGAGWNWRSCRASIYGAEHRGYAPAGVGGALRALLPHSERSAFGDETVLGSLALGCHLAPLLVRLVGCGQPRFALWTVRRFCFFARVSLCQEKP